MSMLTVRLNEDEEKKLAQILAVTQSEKSELVRKLITDQWLALQAGKTFVERRGGHPKAVLTAGSNLSSRGNRKITVAKKYEDKTRRRAQPD